jgi:hypothetical protein
VLPLAEPRDGGVAGRVHKKLISTKSTNGYDLASPYDFHGSVDCCRIFQHAAGGVA